MDAWMYPIWNICVE